MEEQSAQPGACPAPGTIWRVQPAAGGASVYYSSEEALTDAIVRGNIRPDDKVATVHQGTGAEPVPPADAKQVSEVYRALFNPVDPGWYLAGRGVATAYPMGITIGLAICALIMWGTPKEGGWGVAYWLAILTLLWAPARWVKGEIRSAFIVLGTVSLFFRWHGDAPPLPIGHVFECLPVAFLLQLFATAVGALFGATVGAVIGMAWGIVRGKESRVSPFVQREEKNDIPALLVLSGLLIAEFVSLFLLLSWFGSWASKQSFPVQ
jgi:hypothetical protein